MKKPRSSRIEATIAQAKASHSDAALPEGEDFEPPAAGVTGLRLVEYIEMGKHKGEYQGKANVKDKIELVFELIGKKHPPRIDQDGKAHPVLIAVRENRNTGPTSNWRKLFAQMSYAGTATHMIEFIGEAFLGEVFHEKSDDGKRTYANLRDENGYKFGRPAREDLEEPGTWLPIAIGPALSELEVFVWDHADMDDWNAIHVAGEYPARIDEKTKVETAPAKSKNRRQEMMLKADNWKGCGIDKLLDDGAFWLKSQALDIIPTPISPAHGEAP